MTVAARMTEFAGCAARLEQTAARLEQKRSRMQTHAGSGGQTCRTRADHDHIDSRVGLSAHHADPRPQQAQPSRSST
jgi:hypothetical protein